MARNEAASLNNFWRCMSLINLCIFVDYIDKARCRLHYIIFVTKHVADILCLVWLITCADDYLYKFTNCELYSNYFSIVQFGYRVAKYVSMSKHTVVQFTHCVKRIIMNKTMWPMQTVLRTLNFLSLEVNITLTNWLWMTFSRRSFFLSRFKPEQNF